MGAQAIEKQIGSPDSATSWSALLEAKGLRVALGTLASVLRSDLTETQLRSYERTLDGISSRDLGTAFCLAERDLKFFPVPRELRELAGVADTDTHLMIQADAAWRWVIRYLDDHGPEGRAKRGRLLEAHPELRFEQPIPAPAIPQRLLYVLEALGGTVTAGLMRIAGTDHGAMGFLRRDFDAAYLRATQVVGE